MPLTWISRRRARHVYGLLFLAAASCPNAGRAQATVPSPADSLKRAARDSVARLPFNRISGRTLTVAPAFTLEQAMQGKVPGMVIAMNDGAPWSDGQISIRGISTLAGDPSPLVVIDGVLATNTLLMTAIGWSDPQVLSGAGVPFGSTARLRDVTPFDIESVEVLKGPLATARYGVRGAQGVLLITTRRGTRGSQWRALQRVGQSEAQRVLAPRCFGSVASALAGLRPPPDSAAVNAAVLANGGTVPCRAHAQDFFGHTGTSWESGVQWSGGVADSRAMLSATRKADVGSITATGTTRTTVRANLEQRLFGRLTISANVGRALLDVDRAEGGDLAMQEFAFIPSWQSLALAPGEIRGRNPFFVRTLGNLTDAETRTTGALRVAYQFRRGAGREIVAEYLAGRDQIRLDSRYEGLAFAFVMPGEPSALVPRQATRLRRSTQENHLLRLRADQSLGASVRSQSEVGLTIERQRGSVHQFVPGSSREAWAKSDIRAAFMQSTLSLLEDRLTLGGVLRADRSSALSAEPAALWPAASVAYLLPLFNRAERVTVRAAWGQSGGLGDAGAHALNYLSPRPTFINNSSSDRPERRSEQELGADVVLANGRAVIQATVFRAQVRDASARAEGEFGLFISPDGAALSVSGVEVGARARLREGPRLMWDATLQLTSSATTLKRFDILPQMYRDRTGFFGAPVFLPLPGLSVTAMTAINDRPGEPIELANAKPRFDATIGNVIRLGALTVSAQVDWRAGGWVSGASRVVSDVGRTSPDFDEPAPPANSRPLPPGVRVNSLGDSRLARRNVVAGAAADYLTSGAFLRLRELSVRYTLPARLLPGTLRQTPLALSVQGRNLLMRSASWASDPEFSALGTVAVGREIDVARSPLMRQVFIGIDLGL